jgi:CHAT domain-containing protein
MFQLSDLPRHPALVVLSACRTGDGRMVAGEGAQSMARAFTSAGTNGVITGWWNVHDEVAARLMERFYRELKKSISPSEALSSAKRSWLEDPSVPYLEKLPWYWAALNYQGTTAALPANFYATAMTRGTLSRRLWWLFAASLTLIILGGVYRLHRKVSTPG